MRRRHLDIKKTAIRKMNSPDGAKIDNGLENVVRQAIASSGSTNAAFGGGPPISNTDGVRNSLRFYLVTQDRQLLAQAYAEIGLIQTICKVPVEDALRGGIDIQTTQLTPAEITKLKTSFENEDIPILTQAGVWNRLFGGSGILVLTEQSPETPLNLKLLKSDSFLEFRAVDKWELYHNINNDEFDDSFDRSLNIIEKDTYYNYYGQRVHKSRVIRINADTPPSPIRSAATAWGLSVVEPLIRSLNQYLKSTGLIHEVLDEFKIDIYKINGMARILETPNGEQILQKRLLLAQMSKNYLGGLAMDKEDDWDHKQLSFAGIAETMGGIRMQVAADMRMPMTKLFGISAAGFNSGEDDIEVYNSMIESSVRTRLKAPIVEMIRLKARKMFDVELEDVIIAFKPLREMSSEQQENVKTQKFNRLDRARTLGEITSREFRESCNKEDLLGIKLSELSLPDQDEDEDISPGAEDGEEDEDEDTSYSNELGGLRYLKRKNSLDNSFEKSGLIRKILNRFRNMFKKGTVYAIHD